jgi:hypothetical protein
VALDVWLPAGITVLRHRFGFERPGGRHEERFTGPEGPPPPEQPYLAEALGRAREGRGDVGINGKRTVENPPAAPARLTFTAGEVDPVRVRYLIDYEVPDAGALMAGSSFWMLNSTEERSVLIPSAATNVRQEVQCSSCAGSARRNV